MVSYIIIKLLRQLYRGIKKYALAAVLMGAAAFLLGIGISLSIVAANSIAEVNESFSTYGTIEQIPDSYEEESYLDIVSGLGFSYSAPKYTRNVLEEELGKLPKIKAQPLRQELQLAHLFREDGRKLYAREDAQFQKYKYLVCSVYVQEDMVLDDNTEGRKQVMVKEVLYGGKYDEIGQPREGSPIDVNYSGVPVEFKKGEEYIANFMVMYGGTSLSSVVVLSYDENGQPVSEIPAVGGVFSADNKELTEKMIKSYSFVDDNSFLVSPIRSTKEFKAFLTTKFQITDGRDITEEEYKNGDKVCLVPLSLIRDPDETEYPNGIYIGHKIKIESYAKSYIQPSYYDSGAGVNVGMIIEPGNQEESYTIVGAYAAAPTMADVGLSPELILVPAKGESDLPVIATAPYNFGNNSFILENGGIPEFLQGAKQYDNLNFQFNDGGYIQAAAGVHAVGRIGLIMLISGIVSFCAVSIFFIRLEITGGKREAGIRLSLGEKKRRAVLYLVLPLLVSVLIGTAVGIFAGATGSGKLAEGTYVEAGSLNFDRSYSAEVLKGEKTEFTPNFKGSPIMYLAVFAGTNLLCIAGAAIYANRVLSAAPQKLLRKGGSQ